jgi:hypothetical protein
MVDESTGVHTARITVVERTGPEVTAPTEWPVIRGTERRHPLCGIVNQWPTCLNVNEQHGPTASWD